MQQEILFLHGMIPEIRGSMKLNYMLLFKIVIKKCLMMRLEH